MENRPQARKDPVLKRHLKIIHTSFQPYTVKMGQKLHERYGWKPVYWLTISDIEAEVKQLFPYVVTHDFLKAIRGIPPECLPEIEFGSLDEVLLRDLAVHESICIDMMDRNDCEDSFSYRRRREHYLYLLKYWIGVLDALKPDVVFFEEEPHQAVTYLLYALAHRRNILTVMFCRTNFNARMFPVTKFEEGSLAIRGSFQRKLQENVRPANQLSSEIEVFLGKLRASHDDVMRITLANQVEVIERFRERKSFSGWRRLVRCVVHYLKIFNFYKFNKRLRAVIREIDVDEGSDQKLKGKTFAEAPRRYQTARIGRRTARSKKQIRLYYESVSSKELDLNVPFVVCALASQPEKSTSPMGGLYADQLLMIELLRKVLPADWFLYVKEHVSQFSRLEILGEQYRSAAYYDRIRALPNTRLVPLLFDTFGLIDSCKAVATTSGTIGFEAVVRNKPVLTFGYPWYRYCEGVFDSRALSDLVLQVEEIAAGYVPDDEKVMLFIETIQELTFEGVVGGLRNTMLAGRKGDSEWNSEAHVRAVLSIMPDI